MVKSKPEFTMELARGDIKAFESIVDKYERPIYNAVFRMVNNREDAMDITQTVFIKTYEKMDTYDPSRKFFSWLYKIAVNESLNHLKQREREMRVDHELRASQKSTESRIIENETGEHIQRALTSLKFDYRVVLILKHFLELSYKEIGEILEIPTKKVKSRLFTGRQILRETLIKQGYIK